MEESCFEDLEALRAFILSLTGPPYQSYSPYTYIHTTAIFSYEVTWEKRCWHLQKRSCEMETRCGPIPNGVFQSGFRRGLEDPFLFTFQRFQREYIQEKKILVLPLNPGALVFKRSSTASMSNGHGYRPFLVENWIEAPHRACILSPAVHPSQSLMYCC
jgi:hypothetical protein